MILLLHQQSSIYFFFFLFSINRTVTWKKVVCFMVWRLLAESNIDKNKTKISVDNGLGLKCKPQKVKKYGENGKSIGYMLLPNSHLILLLFLILDLIESHTVFEKNRWIEEEEEEGIKNNLKMA